jgi:phenylalanyl-tRNA synthetase beta chain
MPLSRDFAFVVSNDVEADKLVKAARAADRQLVSDVSVFDVFQMPDGKKSIAIAVTLQPRDQTLTDKDIEAISAKIVAQVGKATGGTLRS